jgi:hypothetical protein
MILLSQLGHLLLEAAIALIRTYRLHASLPPWSRLCIATVERPNMIHEAAHPRLSNFAAHCRHTLTPAIQDAGNQLRVGPLSLPGIVGEIGDLRQ